MTDLLGYVRGSVLSSGTIGAALEGSIAGRKSVAISFPFFSGFGNWGQEDLEIALEVSSPLQVNLSLQIGVIQGTQAARRLRNSYVCLSLHF